MKNSKKNAHTFSVNVFGTIGYVGTVGVWVFLIVAMIVMATGMTFMSAPSYVPTLVSYDSSALITVAQPTDPLARHVLQFLLVALLVVATWIFCHMTGRAVSRVIRRMLRHWHKRVTLPSLELAKLSIVGVGLVLLTAALLLFPGDLALGRFALALLGFVSGIVAVGGIGVQQVLVRRYNVRLEDVI